MPRSVVILLAAAIIAPGQTPKKQAASSNAQMGAGILAIASDHQGTLFVDGEGKLDITPTKIVTLKLTAGQHFIDLRDAGGSKLWEKVVIIPAGAQVVERMEFGKPTQTVAAVTTSGSGLTACEELSLLQRWREATNTCKTKDVNGLVDIMDGFLGDQAEVGLKISEGQISHVCVNAELSDWMRRLPSLPYCARLLYELGEHQKALAHLNEYINDNRTVAYNGLAILLPEAYFVRASVKFALSDTHGSLSDFESGFRYLAGQLDLKVESLNGKFMSSRAVASLKANLYRAVILYRIGNSRQAITDFNDYAAAHMSMDGRALGGTPKKLGDLIRNAVAASGSGLRDDRTGRDQSHTDLRQEIDDAEKSGRTSPLPTSGPCQLDGSIPSGMVRYEVKNSTAFDLRVVLSGHSDQEIRLAPNSSQTATIAAGAYKILGKINSPNVVPFFGKRAFAPGAACSSEFYVERKQ